MTPGNPTENQQAPELGLTPAERAEVEAHFLAISEIMRLHNMVKMSGGWRIEGICLDGRKVVHRFSINGYVKAYPEGYDPGNLTTEQLKDIIDV